MTGVLVVGATGTVGTLVAERLADAGVAVTAAARGGAVRFDWHDPDTWDAALTGVDAMYLIAPGGDADPVLAMKPFLDLALAAGVKRAVLQSASSVRVGDPGLGRVHEAVASTFPQWAVLRPCWFMQNFTGGHVQAAAIRTRGEIVSATGTGAVGFVDARDIARVAAAVLTADDAPNRDAVLTGPQALTYDEVAEVISDASGRLVEHVGVSEGRLAEIFEEDGVPAEYARTLAAMDTAIAGGAEDRVTDEVPWLTGTAPRPFNEFVQEVLWEVGGTRSV